MTSRADNAGTPGHAPSRAIRIGDYVASDDNEATLTVVALAGDRALCRWFMDGDVDGDEQEAWIDLAALTVL